MIFTPANPSGATANFEECDREAPGWLQELGPTDITESCRVNADLQQDGYFGDIFTSRARLSRQPREKDQTLTAREKGEIAANQISSDSGRTKIY